MVPVFLADDPGAFHPVHGLEALEGVDAFDVDADVHGVGLLLDDERRRPGVADLDGLARQIGEEDLESRGQVARPVRRFVGDGLGPGERRSRCRDGDRVMSKLLPRTGVMSGDMSPCMLLMLMVISSMVTPRRSSCPGGPWTWKENVLVEFVVVSTTWPIMSMISRPSSFAW
jgi:hypothetical protein